MIICLKLHNNCEENRKQVKTELLMNSLNTLIVIVNSFSKKF